MLGLLANQRKKQKPSPAAHLDHIPPEWEEPPKQWYEVALCEPGNGSEQLEIKSIRRALEPHVVFTQFDGIEGEAEYAVIYRKVMVDDEGEILSGKWSVPTEWQRPLARPI